MIRKFHINTRCSLSHKSILEILRDCIDVGILFSR